MKRIIKYAALSLGILLAASSCSDDIAESGNTGTFGNPDAVKVAFNMDMGKFLTDIEIAPMTRAGDDDLPVNPKDGSYVFNMRRDYYAYLLKNVEGDWYVDRVMEIPFVKYYKKVEYKGGEVNVPIFEPTGSSDELKATDNTSYRLTADQLTAGFQTELTPGNYLITVVINPKMAKPATSKSPSFQHGVKIDPADPPYVIEYVYPGSSWEHAKGGTKTLSVGGEIFVGTSEFTVVKSTDLGSKDAEIPVNVDMKRMTGKMRFLLKDKEVYGNINFAPSTKITYDGSSNPNQFEYQLQATTDKKFYHGVDVFGNFKGEQEHLYLSVSFTRTQWMTPLTGSGRYLVSREGGRTNSLYVFADPEDEVPARIGPVEITRMSGAPTIYWDDTADFTLRGNRWHAFSFEMLAYDSGNIFIQQSLGEDDMLEDPNPMFGPYVEINNY